MNVERFAYAAYPATIGGATLRRPACVWPHADRPPVPLSGTIGSKFGIDATKKLPSECFKRPWPPLINLDTAVKAKIDQLSSRG